MRKYILLIAGFLICMARPLAFSQDDPMMIFARAENLRKSNNFIAAIDEYERAIRIDSSNPRFFFSKGLTYFSLKDYENAIFAFEATYKLKADYVPAYLMAARSYQALNKIGQAAEFLDLAYLHETDEKKRVEYKNNLIKALYDAKMYDEAFKHIEEAIAFDDENLNLLYYKGAILNTRGEHAKAKATLEKATVKLANNRDPHVTAKFYYELGLAQSRLGDHAGASESFKNANFGPYKALIAKMSPRYYVNAAISYIQLYDFEESLNMLNTALEMQKNFAQAYVMMAKISEKQANQSEAISKLQIAAQNEEEPKLRANIYRDIAEMCIGNGRYDEALKAVTEALKLESKNHHLTFLKGVCFYQKKEYKTASTAFDELAGNPAIDFETRGKYSFILGLCYKKMNNLELARNSFKAVTIGPFKTLAQMEHDEIAKLIANRGEL